MECPEIWPSPAQVSLAISIRQPWAWAIVRAGKDVENRSVSSCQQFRRLIGQRVLIHASRGMRQVDYDDASRFMSELGVACPPPLALQLGGFVGTVFVDDIVFDHASRWFQGPVALVLKDVQPMPFQLAKGMLGVFRARY
jgi:hypothetical protein